MTAYKDVVNLPSYPSGDVIQISAVQLWFLGPITCTSQPPGSCKIKEERAVMVPGTRTVETMVLGRGGS